MHARGGGWENSEPKTVFVHPENGQRFLVFADYTRLGYYLISDTGVQTWITYEMLSQGIDAVTTALRARIDEGDLYLRVTIVEDPNMYERVYVDESPARTG